MYRCESTLGFTIALAVLAMVFVPTFSSAADQPATLVSTSFGPCPLNQLPNPTIVSSFFPDSSCLPKDTSGVHPDQGRDDCLFACENSYSTFCTPLNGGNTYTWTVTGGTITAGAGTNCITVLWGPMGSGSVTVIEAANDSCVAADTACVEIIDSPIAQFTANTTVCLNSPVSFLNQSIGAVTYFWNFGDGGTSTLWGPTHAYATPGTYTVTLVATNQCGCSDSTQQQITVGNDPGPVIECPTTVCAFDQDCYSTPSGCPSAVYTWIITGGTPIGPTNTANICVQWGAGPVGTVQLIITGCGGTCPDTATAVVPIVSPTATIAGPNPVCMGATAQYNLPVWPGVYYNWSLSGGGVFLAGLNTPAVTIAWGTTPGNYVLACYWNDTTLGCSGYDSIIVKVRPEFSIFGSSGPYCIGDNPSFFATGPANWTVSGGNPFTGNGTSSISVTWATAGVHTITATSLTPGQFCNQTDTIFATVVAVPPAVAIIGPASACATTPYQYTATLSGPGYTTLWSVTGGGSIIGSPTANPVTVQWSGPGTISVQQVQIAAPQCPSPPISMPVNIFSVSSITGPDTVCMDQSSVFTAGPPNPFLDYVWTIEDGLGNPSGAGSITSGQGTNSINVLWHGPGGSAVVKLTICGSTVTKTVIILPKPTPTISVSGTVCAVGGSASLSVPAVYASYLWSSGGIGPIEPITAAGNYSVIVVNANGCSATAFIDVPAAPSPVASISTPDPINYCLPATINTTLHALVGTGYNYTWVPGGPGGSTLNVSATGTYYVVVTDANGCSSTSNSITVTAAVCPPGGGGCTPQAYMLAIADTAQTPNCNAIDFTAVSSNVTNFSWSFGDGGTDGNVATTSHTYTQAGYYTVTLCGDVPAVPTGTCPVCTTKAVAIPVASDFSWVVACDSVTFTELATHLPANPIISYNWSFPGGSPASSSLQVPPSVYYSTPGSYLVTLTVSDGTCTVSFTDTVIVAPPPTGAFTLPPTACAGSNIPISGTGVGIATWSWDFGDASTSNLQNTSHTWQSGGTYIVSLTVTDSSNCVGTVLDTITIFPPDTSCTVFPLLAGPICQGDSVLLTASAGTAYQWLLGGVPIGGAVNSTYYASVGGNYQAIVYDANGCPCTTAVAVVTVNPAPIVTPTVAPGPVLCGPVPVNLNTYFDATYTYNWTYVSGPGAPAMFGTNTNAAQAILTSAGTYVFQIWAMDGFGCADSATVSVLVHPPAAPVFITPSGSTILCKGGSVTLTSSSAVNNLWNTGATTQSIIVNSGGTYTVTVIDANGCPASASISVTMSIADFSLYPIGCDTLCDSAWIPGPIGPFMGYYTYQWQLNGVNIPPPNGTNQQLNATQTGLYSLILTGPGPTFCKDTSGNYSMAIDSCDTSCGVKICGRKWWDKNGNGKLNYGTEPGIPNWKICLVKCDEFGRPTKDTVACTTTDSSGFYCFENICAGCYVVVEQSKPGWAQTWPVSPPWYQIVVGDTGTYMGLDFGNKWKKIKIWSTKDTIGIPLDPAEPLPLDLSPNEPWPYTITRSTDGGNTWNPFFEGVVDENTDVNPNFLPGMFTITRLSIANYAPYRIYINDTASESISNVAIINLPDSSKGVSVVFTNIYSPDTTVKFRTFTAEQLAGDDQKKPVKRAKKNKPVLMPNTANVIDEILKQGFAIMAGLPDEHNAAGKILPYLLPGKQSNVFKTFNDKSVTHTQQPRGLDVTVKGKPIMKKQKAVQASKHNNRFLANLLALKINIAASDAGKTPAGFGSLIYLGTENYPSFAYQADWTVDEIANHADDLLTNWAGKPYQTYDEMNDVMEAINEAFADSMPIGAEDTTSWMGGKLVLNGVRALDDTPDFIKVEGLGAPRTIRYLSEFPIAELPFDLGQNYPNPFNPTTTISFSLDDPSMVTLKVFTVLGVEVESLADRVYLDEGQWDFDFDAARLSSGVYLYQLTVEPLVEEGEDGEVPGPAMQVRKMLLLK